MSNVRDLPHSICHRDLMLATPGKLFSAPGWLYEIKYDGFRCLVSKHGDVVRLESRRGRDMSDQFPELVSEIRPIPHDFVADGELVIHTAPPNVRPCSGMNCPRIPDVSHDLLSRISGNYIGQALQTVPNAARAADGALMESYVNVPSINRVQITPRRSIHCF